MATATRVSEVHPGSMHRLQCHYTGCKTIPGARTVWGVCHNPDCKGALPFCPKHSPGHVVVTCGRCALTCLAVAALPEEGVAACAACGVHMFEHSAGDIVAHILHGCPKTEVSCPNAERGCPVRILREERYHKGCDYEK